MCQKVHAKIAGVQRDCMSNMLAYALPADLLCIITQRYNRSRVQRLHCRTLEKGEQFKGSGENQKTIISVKNAV